MIYNRLFTIFEEIGLIKASFCKTYKQVTGQAKRRHNKK